MSITGSRVDERVLRAPRTLIRAMSARGAMATPGGRHPLVSVIIAVKNAAGMIERCLDSVRAQTYRPREVIVIDGGSIDGTREILRARAHDFAHWESEEDRGIFHAWNKGVDRARGEWICFLGADDRYAAADTLTRLVACDDGHVDLILGRIALVDAGGSVHRVIGRPWRWEQMKRFQDIAHPGMLHRRTLFERYGGFDERYTIAGDYEFLLRLGRETKTMFIDEVVVAAGDAGISRMHPGRVLEEVRHAQSRHVEIGQRRAAYNYWIACLKQRWRRPLSAALWTR